MTEWRKPIDGLPDWKEAGPIELQSEDGSISSGTLIAADVGFDGEDEYPIWEIEMPGGATKSIWDFEAYRIPPPR